MSMLTDDVVLLAPGIPPIHGSAAARALYESLFQRFARIDQTVATQEIIVAGDWAWSWGTESIRLTAAGTGAIIELEGGMAVMRRTSDGAWKFARAINNDLPGARPR
jgi:ketosteroid isomerase-like protein